MSLVDCQLPGFSVFESSLAGQLYIGSPLPTMVFEQESLTTSQPEEHQSSSQSRHFSEPAPSLLSAPLIQAPSPLTLTTKTKKRRVDDLEEPEPSPSRAKAQRREPKPANFIRPRDISRGRAMSLVEQPIHSSFQPTKYGDSQMYPSPPSVSVATSSPPTLPNDRRSASIPGLSSQYPTPSSTAESFRVLYPHPGSSTWPTPVMYENSPAQIQGEFSPSNPWLHQYQFSEHTQYNLSPQAVHEEIPFGRGSGHRPSNSLPTSTMAGQLVPPDGPTDFGGSGRFAPLDPAEPHHRDASESAFAQASSSMGYGGKLLQQPGIGSQKRFSCNEPGCDGKRSFGTQSNLTRHLKEQHSGVEQKSKFHCRFCPQTFTRKHAMQAHERKGTCRGTL